MSGDWVAAMSVGMTDCQARHGAAASRCTAEPTPSPPSLRGRKKQRRGGITLDGLRPKCNDICVKCPGIVFQNKAHGEHVLAGCTNIHGEEVIDSLRAETLGIALGKDGSNVTKSSRGFLHRGVFTKNNKTGFAVTLDVKMSSEATECWFDLVEQFLGDWVQAGMPSRTGFRRVEAQG